MPIHLHIFQFSYRLIEAEQLVLAAGGNIIRLAGLYHATRGPHTYYLQSSEYGMQSQERQTAFKVDGSGHALLNMLHYEDAASVVVAALESGV
jgi:nucleoside-diphosphate-sugar epimerase